jgi:Protein of unknown function (DUF2892)
MTPLTGNLSQTERMVSALIGLSLSILALRGGGLVIRALNGVAGAGLLARAAAGHCGVKAALMGQATLAQGLSTQWHQMRGNAGRLETRPSPQAARAAVSEDAIDRAANDSFPASDPPASRLPDEPPVNADGSPGPSGK